MADQKVVDYIKEQRAQKVPDNAISDALIKAGYKKEDVDEGFKILSISSTEIPVDKTNTPAAPASIEGEDDEDGEEEESGGRFGFLNKKMIILIGVAVVLLVVLLGSLLFLTLSSQSQEPVEEEVAEEEVEEESVEEEVEVTEEPTAVPTTAEDASALKKQEDIQLLVAALEKFYSEKKYYPANLNDLFPTYLDKILINPDTLAPYKYFMLSNGREYVLCDTPDGSNAKECVPPTPTLTPTLTP